MNVIQQEEYKEIVLFKDNKVKITDKEVVVEGKSYPLDNIKSANMFHAKSSTMIFAMATVGIMLGIIVLLLSRWNLLWIYIALNLLCILFGIILRISGNEGNLYSLQLYSKYPITVMTASKDYIKGLVDAVNKAINMKGQINDEQLLPVPDNSILYIDDSVTVTRTQIIFGSKTYEVDDIKAVISYKAQPVLYLYSSIILFFCSLISLWLYTTTANILSWVCIICFSPVFILSLLAYFVKSCQDKYVLKIIKRSGHEDVVLESGKKYVSDVYTDINKALNGLA